MNIYDTITADQIEDGDQIAVSNSEGVPDYLENVRVEDLGAVIMVSGDSDNTGDRVTYMLSPDAYVDLWAV